MIERLTADDFFTKIREASSWSVKFKVELRERILRVVDENGDDWYYLGPDPYTTPDEEYTAFLINIDMLPDDVVMRMIRKE